MHGGQEVMPDRSAFPFDVQTRRAMGATGATVEETENSMRQAIEFHLDGMREDGLIIPTPSSHVEYVDVAA